MQQRRAGLGLSGIVSLGVALMFGGCGEDASLLPGAGGVEASREAASTQAPGAAHEEWVKQANVAPGYVAKPYPEGPYGTSKADRIANLKFVGWGNPKLSDYDTAQAGTLELADYYDPDGAKGLELILVNAVAYWCGVCQQEYRDMAESARYNTLKARGVEMLGILFEDVNAEPAAFKDLSNWARAFKVEFPFVLDPGFKTGVYFDQSATPMNMVIDARSMRIVDVYTGYDPTSYAFVDEELKKRGR
jgi:thiol-disulfide isomerase/thioredoxin